MAKTKRIDKAIGLRLKKARMEQKLTYDELAEKSGVSTNNAVNWLSKAFAIRAAVRMIFALEGAEERQARMCSFESILFCSCMFF